MEQILVYAWAFMAVIVYVVDALGEWLTTHGISGWVIAIGVFALYGFSVIDKWSIEVEQRLQGIEEKIGIQYEKPVQRPKALWLKLFVFFVAAVYLLGKSLQAEGSFAFFGGIALAGFMLFLWGLCVFSFAADALTKHWRKEQTIRKYFSKGETD